MPCQWHTVAHVQASLLESWIFRFRDESSKKFNCLEILGWPYVFFFFGSASLLSLLDSSHGYCKIIKVQPGPWSCVVEKTCYEYQSISPHRSDGHFCVWVKACICWSYDIM